MLRPFTVVRQLSTLYISLFQCKFVGISLLGGIAEDVSERFLGFQRKSVSGTQLEIIDSLAFES